MAANPEHRLTWEEYLEIERQAEVKSEFYNGEMFLMAGGTSAHSLIASNVNRVLGNQLLERDCHVYTADMRIKIDAIEKGTYPDVSVVCGQRVYADEKQDTLLNPTVIVEVLSDSTEAYDRGKKFQDYQLLDSLMEYILISQTPYRVEHFARQTDGSWNYRLFGNEGDLIHLESIHCALLLKDVYLKVA